MSSTGILRAYGLSNTTLGHGLMFSQTNILVDPEGHARIAGLGAALIRAPIPGVDIDRFFHGAAPELVDPQHVGSSSPGVTKASDVYALAVLSWEVGTDFARPRQVTKRNDSPSGLCWAISILR